MYIAISVYWKHLKSCNLTPKYIQLTFIILLLGTARKLKFPGLFWTFIILGHEFCVISGQFCARHAGHTKPTWLPDRHAEHAKPNATGFTIGMPGMPNLMQLASRSACPACQTGRADRRVTSNNPRNNRGTHFSSSPLLVTKVAN